MKTIPLTGLGGGHVAYVDDADYASLSAHNWYAARRRNVIYAARNVETNGKHSLVYMHREITPEIPRIDHRDRNGLNNQRGNLRKSTASTNGFNSWGRSHRKAKYKGVRYDKDRQLWRARITVAGKEMSLGRFWTEAEAARAYDDAALKLHGQYACPNFQRGTEQPALGHLL